MELKKIQSESERLLLVPKEFAVTPDLNAHGDISEIESGKKKPTVEFVVNVARLFHVSTDQLLKDELDVEGES